MKKLKTELQYNPAIMLLSIDPQKVKAGTYTGICMLMFIEALFTITKKQGQPKCPLMDEWLKKMWHTETMEYYSAIKQEVLTHAIIWIKVEGILPSEISQS